MKQYNWNTKGALGATTALYRLPNSDLDRSLTLKNRRSKLPLKTGRENWLNYKYRNSTAYCLIFETLVTLRHSVKSKMADGPEMYMFITRRWLFDFTQIW